MPVLISGLVAVVLNLVLPEESIFEMVESDNEDEDVVAVEEQKGSSHSTEKH